MYQQQTHLTTRSTIPVACQAVAE